ncbi:MAG TPA: SRPBCC family protein [Longimicrobiaceae bacterium]|jgi:ribosome-associated toxin RatA of RatAB toxin-antitoxin module
MPVVERSVEIRAPREALFDLAQDYHLRGAWDPFTREMRFLDGAAEAAPGVRVRVRAWNGLRMDVEYVTVRRPERVAVRITRGPFFFENFAGSWVFHDAGGGVTRVVFRYSFRTRWGWLRPVLDPVVSAVFGRDVAARVRGLKRAAEETDVLRRLAAR